MKPYIAETRPKQFSKKIKSLMVKLYPGTLEAVLKGLFTRAFLALNHHAAGMR